MSDSEKLRIYLPWLRSGQWREDMNNGTVTWDDVCLICGRVALNDFDVAVWMTPYELGYE